MAVAHSGCMQFTARHASRADLNVGYVPLLDAAPLLVAQEMGFFRRHGVNVRLQPELGWASVREKLLYSELDAAHAPALMAFSLHLGMQARSCPVRAGFLLNRQGNAITLSKRLWLKGGRDAATVRQLIRAELPRRLTFAVVSLFSSHHFLLRCWLEQAGLDPDQSVRIVVLPPSLMGEHMREGTIDGFCAGEPWNSAAVLTGEGWIVADSATLAPRHAEKVLLVRESVTQERAEVLTAAHHALAEACAWCEAPSHRAELADLLVTLDVFSMERAVLLNALVGPMELGGGQRRPASGFLIFHDPLNGQMTESDCRELIQQARGLGHAALPPQLTLALGRRLFLPPSVNHPTRKTTHKLAA